MKELKKGLTVYSYCFGPMTVVGFDEGYVYATVNNKEEYSEEFADYRRSVGDSIEIRFQRAAYGHYYFDSEKDIGKEDDNFQGAICRLVEKPEYRYRFSRNIAVTEPTEKVDVTEPTEKVDVTEPTEKE